jgi:type IV secretory pathway TrbD component
MPRIPCPACNTEVKYPKDVEPGDPVTCPECDEVFPTPKPKKKKQKKYNPLDEETYEVGRAASDADEKEKTRKAGAVMRAALAERRRKKKAPPKPLFGGAEIALLILAGVVTAALGLGFFAAKRFPSAGEGIGIVLAYAAAMIVFFIRLARARNQLGG